MFSIADFGHLYHEVREMLGASLVRAGGKRNANYKPEQNERCTV